MNRLSFWQQFLMALGATTLALTIALTIVGTGVLFVHWFLP